MQTPEKQSTGWTTHAEIEFVDRIASGKRGIEKLRGYLRGMARRVNFGQINAGQVLTYARERLEMLERREESRGVAL